MGIKAFASVVSTAVALVAGMPVLAWSASSAEQSWPHLLDAPNGVECRYDLTKCKRSDWLTYLSVRHMKELAAPAGGRAYRWLWVNVVSTNMGPMPSQGFVEVEVDANGSGELSSGWCKKSVRIEAADVTPFETALAATSFATLPDQDANAANWVDYPPEQLMEADVGGKYHFVYRVGGIREAGIRDAGVLLEKLAQRKCGVSHRQRF